ncbi:hypothetical protein LC607_30300 [Nostoc sp. CHAB 5824]|nr:hypothetical protein [Nostoc sp. CHAB 5824]
MIATDGKLKHLSNGCFTIQNLKSKIQNGISDRISDDRVGVGDRFW